MSAHPRDLPPLPVKERPTRPEKLSQTFLSKYSLCPRSAYFYLKYRGGAASVPMIRGSLFHEVAERCTKMMIEANESSIPPEVAMAELMAISEQHPEWPLPPGEFDSVRLMVYNWAQHTRLDPSQIFGVEQMWELVVYGQIIRGKIDLLVVVDQMATVKDYKSSLAIKSQEAWEREPQSVIYSLLIAFGQPENGLPLTGIDMFGSIVEYPRFVGDDGLIGRQSYRDKLELNDHLGWLTDLVKKIDHAFETGKWPAHPDSTACNECPAALECPLLETLRDGHGEVQNLKDAIAAAEDRRMHQMAARRLGTQLRHWVKNFGAVQYGTRMEVSLAQQSSRKTNYETLLPAIEKTVDFGAPFDVDDHVKTTYSTKLTDKQVDDVESD